MSTERPDAQDLQFEQRLLRSAEADNPTHETRAAWERFSAVTAYVASRADTVSAVHRVDKGTASNELPAPSAELAPAAAGITLSGVGLGMLVGALLSAGVWLILGPDSRPTALTQVNAPPVLSQPELSQPELHSAAPGSSGTALALVQAASPSSLGASQDPGQVARSVAATDKRAVVGAARTSRSRSAVLGLEEGSKLAQSSALPTNAAASLSAQVRLLDHAREALRSGRPGYALGWVERARTEFPRSVLTPDWDFVEIEALRQQGAALATERARTFLRQYPTDPHAHEVRRGLQIATP
jgi:hypothetical protein